MGATEEMRSCRSIVILFLSALLTLHGTRPVWRTSIDRIQERIDTVQDKR